MRLRIIDYIANAGGGVRFAVQLAAAIARTRPDVRLELVSHGDALTRYRSLFDPAGIDYLPLDLAPRMREWCYEPPDEAFANCDHVWFPWMHRHTLPAGVITPVTASFHDAIILEHAPLFRGMVKPEELEQERETTRRWFDSAATIAVSANATVRTLTRLFGVGSERFCVVPISGEHVRPKPAELPAEWAFAREPFLFCPANICPHKNHETLFRGYAQWGQRNPLVLTGQATHLHLCKWERAVELRQLAEELGIPLGAKLHTLGYVSDARYYALLRHARALIMPTLAEGGGSFPVAEAVQLGVPVLCSDIPPVREQMQRMNAEVLWFDPSEPVDLAQKLRVLEHDYDHYKARAVRQVNHLRRRSWEDVAENYLRRFAFTADKIRADALVT